MKRITVVGLVLSCLVAPWTVGANGRLIGDTQVFASIGPPGAPEGMYVVGNELLVGTHAIVRGNAGEGPSKLFRYRLTDGGLNGTIAIAGQNTAATHGILGMTRDAAGRLYVLDRNPPRVLRFDLATETQTTYATFLDLHPCHSNPAPCSPTLLDQAPFPDYPAFDSAGNLYVSDFESATIWRVPPGGGVAQIWFQDARLDSIFGPNGIAVREDQGLLYVAMTGSFQPASPAMGLIYTLPLTPAPTADDLKVFHQFAYPADGPDGIAFGASGKLYVSLAGANAVSVIDADGMEIARWPSPVDNQLSRVPYDLPASLAFRGNGALFVTNQSYFTGNPDHWKVLDVWVDDVAWPLIEPTIA